MTTDDVNLDRLMPRHELPTPLPVRWDTSSRRRLRRKPAATDALILELSLDGARIEVDDPADVEIGDVVEIRLGDRCGTVEVRHMSAGERKGSVLFGVTFVDVDDLRDQIAIAVEHVRGNSQAIREAWEQAT